MTNNRKNERSLEIEKKENFDTPKGIYRAVVKTAFELDEPYKGETETSLRIKWRIVEPSSPFFEYVVAKRYPYSLRQHSKLWKDLESWLGLEGIQKLMPDGRLIPSSLEGLEADIEVGHIDNGQDKPYVFPKRIMPPGSLTNGVRSRNQPILPAPVIASFQAKLR